MLPFEKNTIRIYEFYFERIPKPIPIVAETKAIACEHLAKELEIRGIKNYNWIDLKVITPITGVTENEANGVVYVWAGFENSKDGWLTKAEYKKLNLDE
mgnify:FL=1